MNRKEINEALDKATAARAEFSKDAKLADGRVTEEMRLNPTYRQLCAIEAKLFKTLQNYNKSGVEPYVRRVYPTFAQ